jgi:hypothetical protein
MELFIGSEKLRNRGPWVSQFIVEIVKRLLGHLKLP